MCMTLHIRHRTYIQLWDRMVEDRCQLNGDESFVVSMETPDLDLIFREMVDALPVAPDFKLIEGRSHICMDGEGAVWHPLTERLAESVRDLIVSLGFISLRKERPNHTSRTPGRVSWTVDAVYDGEIDQRDIIAPIVPPGPWYEHGSGTSRMIASDGRIVGEWRWSQDGKFCSQERIQKGETT